MGETTTLSSDGLAALKNQPFAEEATSVALDVGCRVGRRCRRGSGATSASGMGAVEVTVATAIKVSAATGKPVDGSPNSLQLVMLLPTGNRFLPPSLPDGSPD